MFHQISLPKYGLGSVSPGAVSPNGPPFPPRCLPVRGVYVEWGAPTLVACFASWVSPQACTCSLFWAPAPIASSLGCQVGVTLTGPLTGPIWSISAAFTLGGEAGVTGCVVDPPPEPLPFIVCLRVLCSARCLVPGYHLNNLPVWPCRGAVGSLTCLLPWPRTWGAGVSCPTGWEVL